MCNLNFKKFACDYMKCQIILSSINITLKFDYINAKSVPKSVNELNFLFSEMGLDDIA